MIKPPEWYINAYPTYEGWINIDNNQLLVESPPGGFSEDQINEYKSVYKWEGMINKKGNMQNIRITHEDFKKMNEERLKREAQEVIEESNEEDFSKPIEKMTKKELKEYAWDHNIETTYLNKKQIIEALKKADLS